MNIYFMPNGATCAFINGKQIPELQVSWIQLYLKHLESLNYDPLKVNFTMPDQRSATIDKLPDGSYNWKISDQ